MQGEKVMGWHLLRFTLTALSPLSCGAGEGVKADNAIARDALGLPMIPGATLQGLLRRECPADQRSELFGFAEGRVTSAGRILCSNGAVHGADDKAVTLETKFDPLLDQLANSVPLKRDHVRLDRHHGADPSGKFDRAAVPKGTRFSFEWLMFGSEDERELLASALVPLQASWFRIGSSGARGYGRIKLERVHHGFFPRSAARAFNSLRDTPVSNVEGLAVFELPEPRSELAIELTLVAVNPWRSGQNGIRHSEPDSEGREADLAAIREGEIKWDGSIATWSVPATESTDQYILPGSSLRGPIAHRTLFHWNRQNGRMVDGGALVEETAQKSLSDVLAWADRERELQSLLGFAREGKGGEEGGLASPLLFEDLALEVSKVTFANHVKIDRFTGGAMPKALYSEEVIETEKLTARIAVRPTHQIDPTARKALIEALRDLCEGRLAVGAKSYGFFKDGEACFTGPGCEVWQSEWTQSKEFRQ